ncbi:hypothetical protein KKA47_02055 [bacterium]|nr:hypothetical protein [bacterium]
MKKEDYKESLSELCLSVMVDVISCIGKYRDDFVLVGGLVPKVLFSKESKHVGTYDVDFAVNSHHISEQEYSTIADILFKRGYRYRKDRDGNELKFSFERDVELSGQKHVVVVDLIGPEYGTRAKKGFREKIQEGVHVHKARGVDIVFDNAIEVDVTAVLPDGIEHSEKIRVANGAAYLVLKLITFEARKSEKDAYDIYSCLKFYPGSIDALIIDFQPILQHGLVKEAISYMEKFFSDDLQIGPQRFARFMSDDVMERKAYASELNMLVKDILEKLRKP